MHSRKGAGKGAGKASLAATSSGNISTKGKSVEGSGYGKGSPNVEQLSRDIADVGLDPTQEDEWEVIGKKSKSRGGAAGGKPWGSSTSAPKAWGQPDGLPKQGWSNSGGTGRAPGNNWAQAGNNGGAARASAPNWAQTGNNGGAPRASAPNWAQTVDSRRPAGRGNPQPQPAPRTWESTYMAPPPCAAPPPLQHGWQWGARGGSSGSQPKVEDNNHNFLHDGSFDEYDSDSGPTQNQPNDVSDDDELPEDSDDDLSDDYDSDASQKSHETRKRSKWFKVFFEALDRLTVEEISEPSRQWHCPACHNGPGAIDWYKGLQPLITHAKTKGSTRVKLHRELGKLLDEELQRRGTSVIPAGEAFGKWRGLRETTTDHEIVWPPMVIVMNTLLEQDDNDKWIGMGNQELLEYFGAYAAVKARHSYGPRGHRGMSVLIFEPTAMGYLEAERLHKHFQEQGTDKDAWERRPVLFYPGGKRQLYGYLAGKEDMEIFNQHCQGKSRLKFDVSSYQEMVVVPMKQMNEDNQQLVWLKNKVVKQERRSKALEETFGVVSQKLRETMEENRIVRLRTMKQHEENKEEMDYQEQFFKDQMSKVQKDIEEKELTYEKLLQEERAKAKQSNLSSGSNEDRKLRQAEIQRFLESQVKGVEEFEAEREKLIHVHEEKRVDLKRRYLEEEVELEKAFDTALTELMEKYAPSTFQTYNRS